jgi:Cu(I)/Ag(I) efflux system periplasmic protein CusF
MKRVATLSLVLALSAPVFAFAQSGAMKGMDGKTMEMDKKVQGTTHKAVGVVKNAEPDKGTVTLAHEPVKSLNWPAMTMSFAVKDKKLFDKLAPNKKVEVELVQQGSDYVVTAVK